jgi:hypothetical protein
MKYLPTTVAAIDIDIAEAPYLGGEFAVYLTRVPAVHLADVNLTQSGTGTMTKDAATSIKAGGADLQLVATTELRSSVPCVVTFNVLDETQQVRTATATFTAPTRAGSQDANFERGIAVDLVLSGGTLITSVVSLATVVGGNRAVNFALYQLPEAADYVLVGCTTEKKFNLKGRKAVGIDCGMEADAFVKRGKTRPGDMTIDSKFGGMADRLTRFDSSKTTAMLVGIKDGQVTCDRAVFTQYVPNVDINLPEGEGEAMENAATGKFVDHLFFVAP